MFEHSIVKETWMVVVIHNGGKEVIGKNCGLLYLLSE